MTDRTLSDIMDFDHVIQVNGDGTIVDGPAGVYAPDLYWLNDGLEYDLQTAQDWLLMDGWSGQHRYSGPIMHASEFVGGAMERYIREHPGLYVTIACYDIEPDENDENDENDIVGWAVAYIDQDDMVLECETCGTTGNTEDMIEIGGECAHDWCNGTIKIRTEDL